MSTILLQHLTGKGILDSANAWKLIPFFFILCIYFFIFIYLFIYLFVLFFRASYYDLNEKHQPDAVK